MKNSATKIMSLILVCTILLGLFSFSAFAESEPKTGKPTTGVESPTVGYGEGLYSEGIMPLSDSLINRISLTIAQVENRGLRINFATGGTAIMAKIGVKDIKIQRWENEKWVTVYTGEDIVEDRSFHSGSFYSPTGLKAGYYYRATVNHYAKEKGWFFPASQKFFNETNYILIQ